MDYTNEKKEKLSRSEVDSINWRIRQLQENSDWLRTIINFKQGSLDYKLNSIRKVVSTMVEATIPRTFPDRENFVEHKIGAIMEFAKKKHENPDYNLYLDDGEKIKYIISHIRNEENEKEDISERLNVNMIQSRVLDICVRTLGERNHYVSQPLETLLSYIEGNNQKIQKLQRSFAVSEQTDLSFLSRNGYKGA